LRTARKLLRTALLGVLAASIVAPATAAYASPSAGSLQQQIDAKSNALEKVVEQYNKVTIQLQQGRAAQATLAAQVQTQQVAVDAASAQIGQIAGAVYKGGPMNGLNALLQAGSPRRFIDQLDSLNQAARSQRSELAAYQQARARYESDKAKLDQQIARQAAQQNQLAAQRKQINSQLAQLKTLLAKTGASSSGPTAPPKNIPYVAGEAGIAVKFAYSQIGAPYNYAEAGPYSVGYDCSGLTMAAWAKAGVSLPHNADMQYHASNVQRFTARSQLKPGDLVFYNNLGHVGIFVGSGQIIHAPHPGTTVQLASVGIMTPYGFGRPS
jgi:cell wall-associated NlpC family hydrolase